jgi:hypothetical protein
MVYSQIWLNLPRDDNHSDFKTKISKKNIAIHKENEKKRE